MRTVRWGILSTAKIGVEKVIPAMQAASNCQIVGIASRHFVEAQTVAHRLNIPKAYSDYEALVGDPEIDAIYNPLPNHLHVPWTIRALQAGKHVLCEKPLALNTQEVEALAEISNELPHLKVMEAYMYRFHPQWRESLRLVQSGMIGELRTIQVLFSYFNEDPNNVRNIPAYGGGGLMDIGCYPISLSRFIFDREPKRVLGLQELDPRYGVDRIFTGLLDFGTGSASFTVSTQLQAYQRVHIVGTSGRIEIEIPFNTPPDKPTRLWFEHNNHSEQVLFPVCNQYTLQGEAFSQSILDQLATPIPLEDALANMRVIDAIRQSAESNIWVAL